MASVIVEISGDVAVASIADPLATRSNNDLSVGLQSVVRSARSAGMQAMVVRPEATAVDRRRRSRPSGPLGPGRHGHWKWPTAVTISMPRRSSDGITSTAS
jgi:hypothetical protein